MEKIAIVSAGALPLPAVKGGAVESLINYIIDENEIAGKFEITVYSVYDKDASVKAAGNYRNCSFEYIKINAAYKKIYLYAVRVINKIFGKKFNLNRVYIAKVCKVIGNDFDHIIIENRSDFVLPLKKHSRVKIALHIHNDYLNPSTDNGKAIIDSCSRIITISSFLKSQVLMLGAEYEKKVRILKNCTNVELFDRQNYSNFRLSFRSEHGISEDDVVILFSGRIHPTKGIRELVEAFGNVASVKCKLLVVGSSWYGNNEKTDYVREVEKLSSEMRGRIIFTGYIPFDDMPKINAIADIAVVPSMWEEPAGLVVIEAMSTGLPLIVTDSGGIPEYVSEDCAIMLKRDDKLIENLTASMEEMINDKIKRTAMGKAAREYVLQFNTRKYYQDFLDILSEDNAD